MIDAECISFLDLEIFRNGEKLATRMFRKATAAYTVLHDKSHHPLSIINSITLGQFIHIRQNCTCEQIIKLRFIRCIPDLGKEDIHTMY